MTDISDRWVDEQLPATPPIVDVERALLSRLMFSRDNEYSPLFDELGPLKPADFHDPANGSVFAAMLELRADGKPTHAQAIEAHLRANGDLNRARGQQYLLELMGHPMSVQAGRWSVEEILQAAQLRGMVEVLERGVDMGRQAGAVAADVSAKVQEALAALLEGRTAGGAVRWKEMLATELVSLEEREKAPEEKRGLMTGFADLDRLLTGLKPGSLTIVAARPGLGKSTLACDIVRSVAFKHGVPSLAFALEMDRGEIARKLLAGHYKVRLDHLQGANLTDDDWRRLLEYTAVHEGAPLWVDDSADRTLAEIVGESNRVDRIQKLGLIVVDHIGLVKPAPSRRNSQTRQEDVGALSRGLKVLAKKLQVAVVACAQLNRGPEQRTDKRPQLSDLRESGSLEQDADNVILLHREDYYEKESPRAGEVDFILAKQRGGPTDTVTVANQLHYGRFIDMAVGL